MTNIGHFRAAGKMLESYEGQLPTRLWVAPPTKMDAAQLTAEGTCMAIVPACTVFVITQHLRCAPECLIAYMMPLHDATAIQATTRFTAKPGLAQKCQVCPSLSVLKCISTLASAHV